jgi:hexosaminidase
MQDNYNHGVNCTLAMADWSLCYTQNVLLDYWGDEDYLDPNFLIYFSSIHRVLQVHSPDFVHQHVTGDLTYIQPSPTFQGLQSSMRVVIPLVLEYWSVQETDNMPRWFVVDTRDQSVAIIENTNTEDIRNFVLPYVSTSKTEMDANIPITTTSRFALNEQTIEEEEVDYSTRIIPTPLKVTVMPDAETFVIRGFSLADGGLLLGNHLWTGATDLMRKLNLNGMNNYKVHFVMGSFSSEFAGPESYTMTITKERTTITGSDAQGLFHGLMSFIGLLKIDIHDMLMLKQMTVYDKPRFTYRGHQVDVARNFHSKEALMKTIDAMALYKLNVLHLALTNDEGWRLEIPGLEELTSVGAKRCFDLTEERCLLSQLGSGPNTVLHQYYTRGEYIELLQYAQQRNVKIIPEFNMPAHARAAVVAMEARAKNGDDTYRLLDPEDTTNLLTVQFYDRKSIINPCLDSSISFVEKLVKEVRLMHDEAGVPLDSYHFGGDEAKNIFLGSGYASIIPENLKELPFSQSPACQAKIKSDPTFDIEKIANYWAFKVNAILAQNGVQEMFAWEDGLRGTNITQYDTPLVAVNFWETLFWGAADGLASLVDDGIDIIMSNPDYLYFDFPYEVNAEERGYYWGARFNSVYKVFTFAPENLPQNAETSIDRDGNEMSVVTPSTSKPKIRGMQGQTWTETIRTDDQYDEMVFPRMLSVAERSWHTADWELEWTPGTVFNLTTNLVPKAKLAEDYAGFVSALGCRELLKMNKLGISYRVPPPGASIDASGVLFANSELPCTAIAYSMDEGITWMKYSGPVEVGAGVSVSLQSESADGRLKSRIVVAEAVNVVGISVKEESISIPTTASEVVMTESTIPSTAVSQNKTISDQQDFNASMDNWLENTPFSGSTVSSFGYGIMFYASFVWYFLA